ncbi:MAG TPA: ChaN family lipoprotein [Leptospiraceae bacterium]|nr:ChaN family lipoprotein [Leptospiraceae bacterium]
MRKQIFFLSILLFTISLFGQEGYPKIFDSAAGKEISYESIAEKLNPVDVLIIGEEHDDKKGHEEKLKLIRYLSERFTFVISMEMFERDQQIILNEYLAGLIDDKIFQTDLKLWNNYDDYKPIVQYARENKISILAANAPRRYVRILARNGLEEMYKFPSLSRKFFAPIYTIEKYRQENYEHKIFGSLASHGKDTIGLKNMILAQNLWDATMADSILKVLDKKMTKIIHINGRFHSDEYMGVSHRLQQLGVKILTISMFQNRETENIELSHFKKFADIIYLTGSAIPKKE